MTELQKLTEEVAVMHRAMWWMWAWMGWATLTIFALLNRTKKK